MNSVMTLATVETEIQFRSGMMPTALGLKPYAMCENDARFKAERMRYSTVFGRDNETILVSELTLRPCVLTVFRLWNSAPWEGRKFKHGIHRSRITNPHLH